MTRRYTGAEARELAAKATAVAGLAGYAVTACGRVLSVGHNWRGMGVRALAPFVDTDGYLRVRLAVDGRRIKRSVHGLVAAAFHGPRPTLAHQVRHLNGDQTDNRAANLRWGTAAENAADREGHGRTARGARNGARRHPERLWSPPRRVLSIGGVTRTEHEWADSAGLRLSTLRSRIDRQWPEAHLLDPVRQDRKRPDDQRGAQ